MEPAGQANAVSLPAAPAVPQRRAGGIVRKFGTNDPETVKRWSEEVASRALKRSAVQTYFRLGDVIPPQSRYRRWRNRTSYRWWKLRIWIAENVLRLEQEY